MNFVRQNIFLDQTTISVDNYRATAVISKVEQLYLTFSRFSTPLSMASVRRKVIIITTSSLIVPKGHFFRVGYGRLTHFSSLFRG